MRGLLLVLVLFACSGAGAYPIVPDPAKTPGAFCSESDRDFLYLRYDERIPFCRRKVNRAMKDRVYDLYNIPNRCRRQYTIDHFIPLSMGGNNSIENLWPEHRNVKWVRMDLETDVHHKLEIGAITQQEAVEMIVADKMLVRALSEFEEGHNDCDQPSLQ